MCQSTDAHDHMTANQGHDDTAIIDMLKQHNIRLGRDGFIRTTRILPFRPPDSLIPPFVIAMLHEYMDIKDDKTSEKSVLRNYRNKLRRYHLIAQPQKTLRWVGLTDTERKRQQTLYKRKYNLLKSLKQQYKTSSNIQALDNRH